MRERLAALCHKQWSGWMDHLFSKCIPYKPGEVQAEEGAVIMPKWAVDRWKRQASSQYKQLSFSERESDRKEADRFLEIFTKGETKMEHYQERVIEEKRELDEKLVKLDTFIRGGQFALLPADEQRRMNQQGGFMESYSRILGKHIEAFPSA